MPAVVQGQGIIDAIDALDQRMQQNHQETRQHMKHMQHMQHMQQHIRQQILGLDSRLDRLTVEMRARDTNNHVRLTNNELVKTGDRPLKPLYSIMTGDVVPDFPQTLDAVMRLNDNEANGILQHLGHDMAHASIVAKRRRIKSLCGLVAF
ncbi:hypothetical protein GGS23DRAFT_544100 [Durotheca rogersii]|uniref:uncharacterized protein n=1 Tax=Durotheca rogersii TaxID=419775 RepID=UPI00221F1763|nr:uncharacterized protein GGS23DRAFT_544100 [Durotheca rogersii]KAI5868118.1 hypothetical protein GGS23DRAFT_544100 [Durotheca rogersii]